MRLKDLKKNMILPTKEILINKIVKIRGFDVHLLSITAEEDRNVFWMMYNQPSNVDLKIDLEERSEYASNRDEMIDDVSREMKPHHFSISEIHIQGKKMTFSSYRASCMGNMNFEGRMQLQHFIERGISTKNWDEVDLSNIVIASYKQSEDEEFPEIDLSRELDITIKVNSEFKQVLANKPMTLEFGEAKKGDTLSFYDSIGNQERTFYINKMEHYDVWKDVSEKFESEEIRGLSEERIKEIKEKYFICLKEICPKGMNLARLEYESEDDIQLNFYSKEFMDRKPAPKASSSSMMLFKSDKEFGINGFKSRLSMIMPVDKNYSGSIDVELFSWYLKIPEEVITI